MLGVDVDMAAIESGCDSEAAALEATLQQTKLAAIQEELEQQSVSSALGVDVQQEIARLKAKHDEEQEQLRRDAAARIAQVREELEEERRQRRKVLEAGP